MTNGESDEDKDEKKEELPNEFVEQESPQTNEPISQRNLIEKHGALPVKMSQINQNFKRKNTKRKKPKLLHKETLDLEKPKRHKINSMLIEHNVISKPQLSQR